MANAWAQPAADGAQAQREQRRVELRSALQVQQGVQKQGDSSRQLTPQERAELRQQLRQQRDEARKTGS